MAKRPAMLFYTGDWLKDTALRTCSIGARGMWIDMLCYMHDCQPYGYLKVNGKVILVANLARMVGLPIGEAEGYLKELLEAGVCSKDGDGTIWSERMVRDEELRLKRATGGALGGNPNLKKKAKRISSTSTTTLTSKDNLQGYPSLENEDEDDNATENAIEQEGGAGGNQSAVDSSQSASNQPNEPLGDQLADGQNGSSATQPVPVSPMALLPLAECLTQFSIGEHPGCVAARETLLFRFPDFANVFQNKITGINMGKLQSWGEAFNRSISGKMVFQKHLADWSGHFLNWLATIDLSQDPQKLFANANTAQRSNSTGANRGGHTASSDVLQPGQGAWAGYTAGK